MLDFGKVYVASGSAATSSLAEGDILIYPSSDKWNDFGYQTFCEYVVVGTGFGKKFRLAFLNEAEAVQATLLERLNGSSGLIEISGFPPFFSMQLDMDAYREVVTHWGPEKAKELLLALHDVVVVRALEPSTPWLHDALQGPHFQMSFIRSSDAHFAYHNAASLLSGVEFENINVAPPTVALDFQLDGFASPHRFEFSFSGKSLPPRRIAVVIGKNGVGKSRTLNQLILSAVGLQPPGNFHDGEGVMPRLSRIVAVCTPGEAEATFPEEPPVPQGYVYKRISANASDAKESLPEILVTLSRDMRQIGARFRWDIFTESVSQILDFDELVLDAKAGAAAAGEVHLYRLWAGGEQASAKARMLVDPAGKLKKKVNDKSVPLSSGQQSFVRLAAQLCAFAENGSLILMDEPETHLHPNLITGLVAMLDKVLSLTGSIAIIASHSAYLVREVPHSQVHIIRLNDANQTVEILKPRLRTFGADVGAISHFVFGDDIVNRLISHLEEHLDHDADAAERWLASIEHDVSTEAIMTLRREIEKRRGQRQ